MRERERNHPSSPIIIRIGLSFLLLSVLSTKTVFVIVAQNLQHAKDDERSVL